MLLTTVRIEGFRSIKKPLELRVDGLVTVLLGPNDHGKSNILRALTHLGKDRPFTDEDRNWDLPPKRVPTIAYVLELNEFDRRRTLELWLGANPGAPTTDRPKLADVPKELVISREGDDYGFAKPVPLEAIQPHLMMLVPQVELFEAHPGTDAARGSSFVGLDTCRDMADSVITHPPWVEGDSKPLSQEGGFSVSWTPRIPADSGPAGAGSSRSTPSAGTSSRGALPRRR